MQETKALAVDDLPTLFQDLAPIPQDDGPVAVSRIDYPPGFETAYNYFRAVLQVNEQSERALQLTTLCLELNPANYTVWHFRRLCLEALGDEDLEQRLEGEMKLAAKLGGENPKNYQIWYHRRAQLERLASLGEKELLLASCRKELEYTASVFEKDSKNYHSWSFRQWVVQTMNSEEVWKQEMEYADYLVQEDVRCNSAWNHRWFAAHRGKLEQPLTSQAFADEAEFALAGARMDPYNESPWRYFIAVLKEQIKTIDDQEQVHALLSDYESKAIALKQVLLDADRDPEACPNLSSAIIDLLEWKGDKDSLERAMDLSQKLAEEFDPIRAKYWMFRRTQLKEAESKLSM